MTESGISTEVRYLQFLKAFSPIIFTVQTGTLRSLTVEEDDFISESEFSISMHVDVAKHISVYPTHFYDYIVIETPDNFDWQFFDVWGRLRMYGSGFNKVVINTSQLEKGTYLLKLEDSSYLLIK